MDRLETSTALSTDRYLIHFDRKPAKVLLGSGPDDIDPQNALSAFPTVKVADFGQAGLMDVNKVYNPKDYDLVGTPDTDLQNNFSWEKTGESHRIITLIRPSTVPITSGAPRRLFMIS